jgi:succinyl-CoA synthetase alpha subunit
VIIQGITGSIGRHVAERMQSDGYTQLVGGVTPGKGGTNVNGCPVYETVADAVKATGADASLILVPSAFAKEAALEAVSSGLRIAVVYTEGIPVHDSLHVINCAKARGVTLVGPNAAGIAVPGRCNLSEFSTENLRPGSIGIVSKSGTATYEIVRWLSWEYRGISTLACIGGDLVRGLSMADVLGMFGRDGETEAVIIIGEIGGLEEVRAAEIARDIGKPVFSYINGAYAPEGRAMGHAGAIQSSEKDSAAFKQQVLREAGVHVAESLIELPQLLQHVLRGGDGPSTVKRDTSE